MKLRCLFGYLTLSALLCGSAGAALTFDPNQVELHPKISDKSAVAHFKFKNTGDKPVKILSVHSSCGCTTAQLDHDVIAPDESGEIVATFNIGQRTGTQKKTITVTTDDSPDQPTLLTLTANIPQLLTLAPQFVFWSAKDVLNPRTITANVGKDYPVEKLNVTSTDKSINTEVKRGKDDKTFEIVVTPTEAGRPVNSSLKIETDYPKDAPRIFYANVRVDSRAKLPSDVKPEVKPVENNPQ
jgi:hypothetical protein